MYVSESDCKIGIKNHWCQLMNEYWQIILSIPFPWFDIIQAKMCKDFFLTSSFEKDPL